MEKVKYWFEIEIPHHRQGAENWNGSEFVIDETTEYTTKEEAESELVKAKAYCDKQGWLCEPYIACYHD